MRLLWRLLALVLLVAGGGRLGAQDASLHAQEVAIVLRPDSWGRQQAWIEGRLHNEGPLAWSVQQLVAELRDGEDTLLGEGFGFLTGVCGEALPEDYALQPGDSAPFALQLELFDVEEAPPDARIQVIPRARSRETAAQPVAQDLPGVTQVDGREVVELEWVDAQRLRYSSGCWREVFTRRDWHELDLRTGESSAVAHPRAAEVTPALLAAIQQTDPLRFRRSFFSFAPGGRRALYQNVRNSLVTAEPNGSFLRVVFDGLYNITLQGIMWQGTSGNFLAWYHGGPGQEVRYAVGNAEGRPLSQHPVEAIPSFTVPGLSADGRSLVISATIDGVTGYFLKDSATERVLPLFAAGPPGNHWPAPWYAQGPAGRRIYIARPLQGAAWLQCYNPDSATLHDLTALPLQLAPEARGRMALAPDFNTLALAADGARGGLWLVDLRRFADCA